jgi:hypothetical protein
VLTAHDGRASTLSAICFVLFFLEDEQYVTKKSPLFRAADVLKDVAISGEGVESISALSLFRRPG